MYGWSRSVVACDPKLMGAKTWINMEEKLSQVGVNLTSFSQNMIDDVWTEDNGRPPANVTHCARENSIMKKLNQTEFHQQ